MVLLWNRNIGNKVLVYEQTHLAGDGSFRKNKFKEFCQFRLNLLIKISYIPDLKNFWSRDSKVMAKKDFLKKKIFL